MLHSNEKPEKTKKSWTWEDPTLPSQPDFWSRSPVTRRGQPSRFTPPLFRVTFDFHDLSKMQELGISAPHLKFKVFFFRDLLPTQV